MIIGVPGVDDAYKQANVEAQNKYGNQITRVSTPLTKLT